MTTLRTGSLRMRFRFLVFALVALVIKSGCEDIRTFDVSATSSTLVEGSALGGLLGDLDFADFTSVDLTATEEFENQGVAPEDIDSVRLSKLSIKVVTPEGNDLAFLKTLAFFVEADGFEKRRIAHWESFAEGVGEVELDRDDVELAEYVTAPSMAITVEVTADSPAEDTELRVDALFHVIASPEGACKAASETVQESTGE